MDSQHDKHAQEIIVQAMQRSMIEISTRNFSMKREYEEKLADNQMRQLIQKNKSKLMIKLNEVNQPWFIRSKDGTTSTPVNDLDSIRIHGKKNSVDIEGDRFWSPIHLANFNTD